MRLHHANYTNLPFAALLGLALLGTCCNAAAESVLAAVNANDVTTLESLARSTATPQRSLAAGALFALRHEDAKAISMLTAETRSTADHVMRATAYAALAEVYLRDQRYRACYSAFRAALHLSTHSLDLSERQDVGTCKALVDVKPMRVVRDTPGSLPITRDMYGLIRVPVTIGGRKHEAVVDTGAGFSTISSSAAKGAGVQMLSPGLTVGTASKKAVAMRLGIARRLQIGSAILTNVVFIVMPDSDLSFPHGYRVRAVIGLPVLMTLGRLEFVNSGAPRLLYDVPRGNRVRRAGSHSNMLLSGNTPLVLVGIPGISNSLRMILDTGSPSAMFSYNAVKEAPALFTRAKEHVLPAVGAGGVVKERRAMILPDVTLAIGARRFKLKNVPVDSPTSAISSYGVDGIVGQNILRQSARWTLDFKTMTLGFAK